MSGELKNWWEEHRANALCGKRRNWVQNDPVRDNLVAVGDAHPLGLGVTVR